jgi:hypothetical protein
MKKLMAVFLMVATLAFQKAFADTNTTTTAAAPAEATPIVVKSDPSALPPAAEAAKSWIQAIGDQTQIVGGYAFVANSIDDWEGTATVGVQGNIKTFELKLPLNTKTTVKPGLCYLYGITTDVHLVGLGVAGTLAKIPDKVADLKNETGLLSKLPGNLESVSWHVGVGTKADEAKLWLGAALSIKW